MIRALATLLLVAAVLPLPGWATANLSLSVTARSNGGTFGDVPAIYSVSAAIFMPPTGYRLTSSGGMVTTSVNGNSASGNSPSYFSWDDFVDAEAGQWTLTTNVGGPGETNYFFDVGFGSLEPVPFVVDAHPTAGGPAGQWTVDISGPVDRGSFQLGYSIQTPGGPISQVQVLAAGTTQITLTVPPDATVLSVQANRFNPTNEFTISVPTTIDGIALAGWNGSSFVGYYERGMFLLLDPNPPEPVPEAAHTLGLLLIGLGSMAAWRRTRFSAARA